MAGKVAVVTGSNKGIGFATVRELCRRGIEVVLLTSRDAAKGKEATQKLEKEGYHPKFYQLDVTSKDSVKNFSDYLKQKHGGIDILINNAAIVEQEMFNVPYEVAKQVIDTNYFSLQEVQEYLFPILRENARVINIASDCGHISNLENKYWIRRLTNKGVNLQDIEAFIRWFLESIKNQTLCEDDWRGMNVLAYRVSKIAVCVLTRIQQREVKKNISVNSVHPGLVQTDMTRNNGMLTTEQSAEALAYLALDVDQSVKGKYFWYDKTEKDWADHSAKLHFNRDEIVDFLKETGYYDKNVKL